MKESIESERSEDVNSEQQQQQDLKDIALAHRYRLSLTTLPTQSSFRVVAVVFYKETTPHSSPVTSDLPFPIVDNDHDSRKYLVGTNDEPGGFIGGSICAERAALVQLRFLPNVLVTKIAIVTDHELPISPGMLCREFMAGHAAVPWNVPIVLAGSGRCGNGWTCTRTTLRQLYPHPSPYARLTASQANSLGKAFSDRQAPSSSNPTTNDTTKSLPESSVLQLMAAARKASHKDTRMGLHPIQFGAAVMFQDETIASSHQQKALEYGATLDAVSQLAPLIEQSSSRPVALVQVDGFGIAHAPFAPARAFLSEHWYEDCRVLVHCFKRHESSSNESVAGDDGELVEVLVSDLAPSAPDMGDLWSC